SGVIRDRPLRGSSVTPGTGEPEATGSSGTYVPGAERRGAENLGDDFRGKAAPIVRQLWWQGKRSPLAEWDMGDEYSFLDPQAEREGWPIVLAAMRQVPGVYSRNGKSFTGKLVFSKKNRDLWNICLDRARRELYGPSDPSSSFEGGGGSIGGLLEEVIT
ncbi:MAG: hypothetical protein ACRD3V_04905, partial [Vicinamibacteria bacterium]